MSVPEMVAGEDELYGGRLHVLEGRDDWLFLSGFGDTDVIDLYTNEAAVPDSVYRAWADVLRQRHDYFAERGVLYLTLVIPDAHHVYSDKLPPEVARALYSPYDRLVGFLDERTRSEIVYVRQALIDGRAEEETYQSVDSHWTDWGGWLGYRAAIEALAEMGGKVRVLEPDEISWSIRPTFGALGPLVTPERSADVPIATVRSRRARLIRNIKTEVRDGFVISEMDAPHLDRAVLFRDSFMTALGPFFAESFRRAVMCSSPNTLFYDLLDQERPDIVVHELCERRLRIAPDEPGPLDFRMLFGDLILDDERALADQRRSRSMMRVRKYAEALSANDDVLVRQPPTARLMMHRARVLAALGNRVAGIEALRHATTLDPEDAGAWFYLGHALDQHGQHEMASAASARAVALEPRQRAYWSAAIAFSFKAHDLELCRDLLSRGRSAFPDDAAMLYAESMLHVEDGDLAAAAVSARRAVELVPSQMTYNSQLASVLVRQRDWSAAHDCLTALVARWPDEPEFARYLEVVGQHLAPIAR